MIRSEVCYNSCMESRSSTLWVAVGAVIVIAGAYGIYATTTQAPSGPGPGGNVCTTEALLCPDGTYVSRTGPGCAFTPCPGNGPFTGTLRVSATDISLLIPAPKDGGEVTYVLPLDPGQLSIPVAAVGHRVRVAGHFTEGIRFSVANVEELTGDEGDPTIGEVWVGESVLVNGVLITLNAIPEDSRCPLGTACIWEGRVRANVSLRSTTDFETRDITTDGDAVAFDSYQVSIEEVRPAATLGTALAPGDYTVAFRVRSN
jgi:hypothetical protein